MEQDQEQYLDEARQVVKQQAYFMRKSLDNANLRDALRYSATMLSELRTSLLSPKNYYQLFIQIFDEMRELESYFKEEYRRGRKMNDLYESVQHATSLIPRLYLLITVGSVYIQTHEVGANQILTDLLEMIKAVQHPLRGLFIRYYFLKMCKERLPDKGSEYEGEGGDINDAINVITRNLTEMNKLWIRMGGGSQEKSKRERERIDLKVTVGENLHRLSSLEGVNQELYKSVVLPKLIDLITHSKDAISQQYLIDIIIQTFPDEYHLNNLETLLTLCTSQVQAKVDVKTIFIRLMDRLADFAINSDAGVSSFNKDVNIYDMFQVNIDKLIESASNTEFQNVLDLMVAYLKFSIRCYPEESSYVNEILKSCVVIADKQMTSDFDDDCQKNIIQFLTQPLETMSLSILTMNEYPNLMKYLPFAKRRQVSKQICQTVVEKRMRLDDFNIAKQLLSFINPLLITESDYTDNQPHEFDEEQNLVSRLIHLVQHEDNEVTYAILCAFIEQFKEGGPKRVKYTFPASFFALCRLTRLLQVQGQNLNYSVLFQVMRGLVDKVRQTEFELSLKLYLQLVLLINEVDTTKYYDEYTYDIASQALMIYEENVSDNEKKLRIIKQIIGSLSLVGCVTEDNYDTLATNTTSFCSKFIKKTDQCTNVLDCSHLFYNNNMKDDQKVSECFKQTLQLADACMKPPNSPSKNCYLYIHIVNKFFYYWTSIGFKSTDVQECINIIQQRIAELEKEPDEYSKSMVRYWKNTKTYIQAKRDEQIEGFEEISI